MIITRTPLRISFAGGGTDIPSFYKKNSYGCVLSSAINKYIYVSVKSHSDIYPEKIRLNYSETENVKSIEKIKNPIIKACLKYMNIDENIYISTVADAPGSSGLGSSSTFCVGLLNALYAYKGKFVNRNKLAEEAAHIEINILKRPIGKQDHYAAAFGSINLFKFYENENVSIMPVDENSRSVKMIFNNLSTFYTGIDRDASKILKSQKIRHLINNESLLQIRNQSNELFELIKKDKFSLRKFGEFLDKGWKIKKSLSNQISNKFINNVYDIAKKEGAYGGKLSGAGGGGFLSFVAKKKNMKKIIKKLIKKKLKHFPIKIDSSGSIILSKN
jgi:D-glycero-alpha-D-manno-heptose-7-phosphate kinase